MSLLGKAKIFSKLDIRQAYHRIRLATAKDCEYTTFSTAYGNYRYSVLPFGLTSAPATFQRFMNEKFMKVLGKTVVLYLDDILIFSSSREEHERHVREVLEILRENDIQADIKKCEFYTQSVKYLGLIITLEGI